MSLPAKTKWVELWQRLRLSGDLAPYYSELESHYLEPHRTYHNLTHILDCLQQFSEVRHLAQTPDALEMAIWYHDVIYDSKAKDNEERSAALAQKTCHNVCLPDEFVRKVTGLILATKRHESSNDNDTALIIDIDLSILGRDSKRFAEYEGQIRREYSWVSDAAFADGRATVLETFAARNRIYFTDWFHSRYEQQARTNLIRSIQEWRAKLVKPH